MTVNWLTRFGKLSFTIPFALTGVIIGWSDRILAQIIPDNSLGSENSVVNPINSQVDQIDGGAIRGSNLFHSFQEFNIGEGRGVYFANPAAIQTILSRVTGGNPSHLLGTLGVLGEANLIFINPSGIIFGSNAQLDMRGSFVASTSTNVTFPDGTKFSAINPEAPPLLTVNVPVPIGLQFQGEQPGAIVNAGKLAVESGQNLALVGGTVVSTGQLSAPSGEVAVLAVPGVMADGGLPVVQLEGDGQLLNMSSIPRSESPLSSFPTLSELLTGAGRNTGLSVTNNGEVQLTGTGINIPTDTGTAIVFGSINVSGNTGGRIQVLGDKVGLFDSNINASGTNGGGTVLIGGNYQGLDSILNASRTVVSRDSVINADALVSGNGGQAIVWADGTTGFYGNISARGGSNSGNGGFVEVSGKENLIFRGNVDVGADNGSFGTLLLDPENIIIVDGAAGSGADDTELGDSTIFDTDSPGETFTISRRTLEQLTGNVLLEATNDITVAPGVSLNFVVSLNYFPSGSIRFTADADNNGIGSFVMDSGDTIKTNGRDITISGATITTGTIDSSLQLFGILLGAGDITLTTNGNIKTGSLNAPGVGVNDVANPGNITLTSLQGSIDTSMGTLNSSSVLGDGGAIALSANSNITTGEIIAASANGNGGTIELNSSDGEINTTRGTVTSGSLSGNGGAIALSANSNITTGEIIAASANGNGGTIEFNSSDGAINSTAGTLNSASLSGNGGAIALKAADTITTGDIASASFDSGNGGRISLTSTNGEINTTGGILNSGSVSGDGGAIALSANRDITIIGTLVNSSSGSGAAGSSITLTSEGAISLNNSLIVNKTDSGTGGDINFTAQSVSITNESAVVSKALNNAQAGNINVNASNVELNQRSYLATQNRGTQPSGNVTIETERLSVQDGSIVSASTDGDGRGGTLTVKASDSVDVTGTAPNGVPSILASVSVDQGQAGDVKIDTSQLRVRGGGTVSAAALDGSQGGNLIVNADSVIVSGTSVNQLPSNLTVDTAGQGNAGNMEINSRQLIVERGGVVSASTYASGQGGSITVNATDVELGGASPDGQFKSGIYAQSFARGNAGSVTINTQQLTVEDGARVSVSSNPSIDPNSDKFKETETLLKKTQNLVSALSQNIPGVGQILSDRVLARGSEFGNAGNITITADTSFLNNEGQLVAETFSGEGGNINLDIKHLLLMRDQSLISATAGTAPGGGDGGNITISAPFIIGVPKENSDITANAFTGKGGNINITTQAIFGLKFRPRLTPRSDITVSSEFGIDGIFELNLLGIDPSRGLTRLPQEPVNPEITEGCQGGGGQAKVEFFNYGSGGLRPGPDGLFSPDFDESASPKPQTEQEYNPTDAVNSFHSDVATQGAMNSSNRQMVRSAPASTVPRQLTPSCRSR